MGQPTTPQRKPTLAEWLNEFAHKHKDTPNAGNALMSFLRGECEHMPDSKGKCQLCQAKTN